MKTNINFEKYRLGYLDGLRGIAVLAVVIYHYFSHFENDGYYAFPSLSNVGFLALVHYGYYGVQLFFVISGFVIAMTLFKCNSIAEFALRRFARLWPAMLLCSILTFVYLSSFNGIFATSVWNLVPSLTFIEPYVFNKFWGNIKFDWIDGAYWSLFVEVRFYAWISLTYFLSKNFERDFLLGCGLVYMSGFIITEPRLVFLFDMLFFTNHLFWFVLGMGFYFYQIDNKKWAVSYFISAILFFAMRGAYNFVAVDCVVFALIFFLFIALFKSIFLRNFFAKKWLSSIGVSSYSLYLLHQNIGVDINFKMASFIGVSGYASAFLPFVTLVVMIGIAHCVYCFYEKPVNRLIVRLNCW